uniref:Uncharacterized protein n=1 Tax=Burkholderia sp. M701 TaxID=326454 RepID=V5YMH0_9BURK|nr:hypothetical protein [Burkholderia sp. M701]
MIRSFPLSQRPSRGRMHATLSHTSMNLCRRCRSRRRLPLSQYMTRAATLFCRWPIARISLMHHRPTRFNIMFCLNGQSSFRRPILGTLTLCQSRRDYFGEGSVTAGL